VASPASLRLDAAARHLIDKHVNVSRPVPTLENVKAFLGGLHDGPVSRIEALEGGFWSSAFAYRVGDRELVLRLGSVPGPSEHRPF
jgi:hypothetical protein